MRVEWGCCCCEIELAAAAAGFAALLLLAASVRPIDGRACHRPTNPTARDSASHKHARYTTATLNGATYEQGNTASVHDCGMEQQSRSLSVRLCPTVPLGRALSHSLQPSQPCPPTSLSSSSSLRRSDSARTARRCPSLSTAPTAKWSSSHSAASACFRNAACFSRLHSLITRLHSLIPVC